MIEDKHDRAGNQERGAEPGIRTSTSSPVAPPEPDDDEPLEHDRDKSESEIDPRKYGADTGKDPEEIGKRLNADLPPMNERGSEKVPGEQRDDGNGGFIVEQGPRKIIMDQDSKGLLPLLNLNQGAK